MHISDTESSVERTIKTSMTEQEFIEHLRSRACAQRDDGRNLTCLALSNAQSKSRDLVQRILCSSGFITLILALFLILNLGYG